MVVVTLCPPFAVAALPEDISAHVALELSTLPAGSSSTQYEHLSWQPTTFTNGLDALSSGKHLLVPAELPVGRVSGSEGIVGPLCLLAPTPAIFSKYREGAPASGSEGIVREGCCRPGAAMPSASRCE